MDDKQKVEIIKQGLDYIHSILADIMNDKIDKDEILVGIELLEIIREGKE